MSWFRRAAGAILGRHDTSRTAHVPVEPPFDEILYGFLKCYRTIFTKYTDSRKNYYTNLFVDKLKTSIPPTPKILPVLMTLLTSMVLNSGTTQNVMITGNEIFFIHNPTLSAPSHWPLIRDANSKIFVFRVAANRLVSKSIKIPARIADQLSTIVHSHANTSSKSPADLEHDNAFVVDIYPPDVMNNEYDLKTYKIPIEESTINRDSTNELKQLILEPLSIMQIMHVNKFASSSTFTFNEEGESLDHPLVARQIKLAKLASDKRGYKFNSPELFPWFMYAATWNYETLLQTDIVTMYEPKDIRIDSIIIQKVEQPGSNDYYICIHIVIYLEPKDVYRVLEINTGVSEYLIR